MMDVALKKPIRDRYHLLEKIGQGAVGHVFEAYDIEEKRFVAIKIVDGYLRPDVAQRFLREGRVVAELLSHPNIVEVYEFGEDQGCLFIAMELLDGADLRALVQAEARLEPADKIELMVQICQGVGFAHRKQIVHRDLTPSNIHVLPSGRIKIMDFGLVHLASSELTRAGAVMGTPSYMSPEQAEGKTVTTASDVFSLGAVFYELLSYKRAFDGDSLVATLFQVIHDAPPPLEAAASLVAVIDRALSKNPHERPRDANELARDLAEAGRVGSDVHPRNASTPEALKRIVSGFARSKQELGTPPGERSDVTRGSEQFTTLAGDLVTTRMGLLLRYCTEGAKTGALHLRRGPIEKRIFFLGGRLFSTATNSPRETLGQLLIRSGYITEEQLHEALAEHERTNTPLGRIVVAKDWVDAELMKDLVRLKAEESIYDCFLWPDGEFAFEDDRVPLEIYLSVTLDVKHLILEGERRLEKWKQIRELFPSSLTTFSRISVPSTERCTLSTEERRFLELVDQGKNLAEIALEVHAVDFYAASLLLDLHRKGLIEVAEAPDEPSYEEKVRELQERMREGVEQFDAGENEKALAAFERALAIDPQSKAYLYIERIKDRLGQDEAERSLSPDKIPVLDIGLDELETRTLTPEEAFVLSRVNGQWALGALLQICPMSEQEVSRIFRKLLDGGLLKFVERDEA